MDNMNERTSEAIDRISCDITFNFDGENRPNISNGNIRALHIGTTAITVPDAISIPEVTVIGDEHLESITANHIGFSISGGRGLTVDLALEESVTLLQQWSKEVGIADLVYDEVVAKVGRVGIDQPVDLEPLDVTLKARSNAASQNYNATE
jgi:hypothetical protein